MHAGRWPQEPAASREDGAGSTSSRSADLGADAGAGAAPTGTTDLTPWRRFLITCHVTTSGGLRSVCAATGSTAEERDCARPTIAHHVGIRESGPREPCCKAGKGGSGQAFAANDVRAGGLKVLSALGGSLPSARGGPRPILRKPALLGEWPQPRHRRDRALKHRLHGARYHGTAGRTDHRRRPSSPRRSAGLEPYRPHRGLLLAHQQAGRQGRVPAAAAGPASRINGPRALAYLTVRFLRSPQCARPAPAASRGALPSRDDRGVRTTLSLIHI